MHVTTTLEQLLAVLKPEELVNISVYINPYVSETFYSGTVERLPENFYEKYKDYIVFTMHTPDTFDPDYPYYDMAEDTQQNFEEIPNRDKNLQIMLTIPKPYPYYKYTLRNLLDTIANNEKISIYDPTAGCVFFVYEGIKKNMPERVLNTRGNRKIIFVEKPVVIDANEEHNLVIYIEEKK